MDIWLIQKVAAISTDNYLLNVPIYTTATVLSRRMIQKNFKYWEALTDRDQHFWHRLWHARAFKPELKHLAPDLHATEVVHATR